MTPAARAQAAIEVLDLIIAAARDNGPPADRLIADWFRPRRFAGSGDRRAVRELVYRAIRACGEIPASGRAALLRLAEDDPSLHGLFDGSRHGPASIEPGEPVAKAGTAPAWLETALADSDIGGLDAEALMERAPLDLRVNAMRASPEMLDLPLPAVPTQAPMGLRLPPGTPVEQWDSYAEGLVEVQDTGSQIACLALAVQPGETVIDLCAGAGGKTLALAAAMDDRGVLIACDTDRGRLSRLQPRAERARVTMIDTLLLDPGREAQALAEWRGGADAVLIDAPCSGTGTWRRNPEARWRNTEAQLTRHAALQARLLDIAQELVRPGGRIVYVTCSLLDAEGADQVDGFLKRHPDWRAEQLELPAGRARGLGVRLTPFHDGTDGFFIARLAHMC